MLRVSAVSAFSLLSVAVSSGKSCSSFGIASCSASPSGAVSSSFSDSTSASSVVVSTDSASAASDSALSDTCYEVTSCQVLF